MKTVFSAGVAGACLLAGFVTLASYAAPQNKPGAASRIGQFFIRNAEGDAEVLVLPGAGTRVSLRGDKLSITSSRYDIAAPKIVLTSRKNTPPTADATGSVRIAVRNPEQAQDTTLTSNSARYVGASAGKNPFIYATGNVRVVTRSPDFDPASPSVIQTRAATVELLPDGGYRMSFAGFIGEGTLLEKPAKPAPKTSGKKP